MTVMGNIESNWKLINVSGILITATHHPFMLVTFSLIVDIHEAHPDSVLDHFFRSRV